MQVSVFYYLHCWGSQGLYLAVLLYEKHLVFPEVMCVLILPDHFALTATHSGGYSSPGLWIPGATFMQTEASSHTALSEVSSLALPGSAKTGEEKDGGEGWFMHLLVCSVQWVQPQRVQITYAGTCYFTFATCGVRILWPGKPQSDWRSGAYPICGSLCQ